MSRAFVPFDSTLTNAIATYGAWIVGGTVAIESMGIPVPGETILVTAAVYAGTTGELNVVHVILAAIIGAIAGDNAGFWIGRTVGFRWVVRHRSRLRLTTRRLKLGQYLFMRHGGKVVFFGRFVAVLRALAAFLAGANRMPWRRVFAFNGAGGFVWASVYAGAAYGLGTQVHALAGPVGFASLLLAAAFLV